MRKNKAIFNVKKLSLQHVLKLNALKKHAKLEIEQQKEKAVAAIREQVASLSVLIASKVIEKELNAARSRETY